MCAGRAKELKHIARIRFKIAVPPCSQPAKKHPPDRNAHLDSMHGLSYTNC